MFGPFWEIVHRCMSMAVEERRESGEDLKVLIITTDFPPCGRGGAAISADLLRTGLIERGANVMVVATGDGCAHFSDGGRPVSIAKKLPTLLGYNLMALLAFGRLREKGNIDMIHVFNIVHVPLGLILARATGAKLVTVLNCLDACCDIYGNFDCQARCGISSSIPCAKRWSVRKHGTARFAPYQWLKGLTLRWCVRRSDAYIALSDSILQAYRRMGIDVGKARIIPNALNEGQYRPPSAIPSDLVRREGDFLFGYVGRLSDEKGVDIILKAMALGREGRMRLAIVGDGPYQKELERMTDELGLRDRVQFLGRKAPSDLPDYLAQMDSVVFPSLYPEPFSRVTLEAMYYGKPLVCSAVGSFIEATDGHCLAAPPGDEVALHQAMVRMMEDEGLRRSMVQAYSGIIGRYDRQLILDRTIALYREKMGKRA